MTIKVYVSEEQLVEAFDDHLKSIMHQITDPQGQWCATNWQNMFAHDVTLYGEQWADVTFTLADQATWAQWKLTGLPGAICE